MKAMRFLSDLKYRTSVVIILPIFGLFFFAACATGEQSDFTLADAETAGLIMSRAHFEAVADEGGFEVVRVELQDITAGTTFMAPIVFPVERQLRFQATEGAIGLYVEVGQRVREGDVLARLTSGMDTRLELDHFAARQRLEQFEEGFETELERRRLEIEAAGENMAALDEDEDTSEYAKRQAYLGLQLLELGLERFVFSGGITRDTLQNQVSVLYNLIDGEEITAPFDGIVTFLISRPFDLGTNPPIVTIVDDSVFFFEITMGDTQPMIDRYDNIRHGDIITLRAVGRQDADGTERPVLEFDARVVTESWASGMRGLFTYWLKPVDMQSFHEAMQIIETGGLPGPHNLLNLAIRANVEVVQGQNSLVLPNAAVRLEEPNNNYVFIYNNGRPGKRFIQIGIRSGGIVEIISGLEAGAEVVILP